MDTCPLPEEAGELSGGGIRLPLGQQESMSLNARLGSIAVGGHKAGHGTMSAELGCSQCEAGDGKGQEYVIAGRGSDGSARAVEALP